MFANVTCTIKIKKAFPGNEELRKRAYNLPEAGLDRRHSLRVNTVRLKALTHDWLSINGDGTSLLTTFSKSITQTLLTVSTRTVVRHSPEPSQ